MNAIATASQTDVTLNDFRKKDVPQRSSKSRLSAFLVATSLLLGAVYDLTAQCVQFVNCPSNRIAYACGSNCVPVTFDLQATNYCDPTNVVVISDYPSGYCFPLGTTWVHANVYGSGYSNSCTFPVTVLSNCPPSGSLHVNVYNPTNYACGSNCVIANYSLTATSSDHGCTGISFLTDSPSGNCFGIGTHTVHYRAVCGGSGESVDGEFQVVVLPDPNCPPPQDCLDILCPTNVIAYACGSNCVPVNFSVWATNYCSSNMVVTYDRQPNSYFCPGTTWVTATVSGSGQPKSCMFPVTVLPDPNCNPSGCTNCNTGCSTNLLVNGSFENPGVPDGYLALSGGSATVNGWVTLLNGVEYYNPVAAPTFVNTGFAAEGAYLVDLASANAVGGGIQQTFATVPGRSHRVSFAMGTSKERGRNGTASLTVTVAGTAHAFNLSTGNPRITWERKEFSFVATSSTTTLVFSTMDDPALSFVNLDDVRVSDCCTDPGLKIKSTITVEWSCGILQSAPEVTGPYTDVPGATSPYTTTATGLQRFFRTR